jgi:hypothetical protein
MTGPNLRPHVVHAHSCEGFGPSPTHIRGSGQPGDFPVRFPIEFPGSFPGPGQRRFHGCQSAGWTASAAGREISGFLRIGNETGTNPGSPDCDGRPVNCPSARPELVIETPDDTPTLTTGAARALAGLLRAAASARLDRTEIGHSGEEPEAIAS